MKLVKLILWGIIALYLQVLFIPRLSIAGIEPSLMIPFIIFCSITLNPVPSLLIAFFGGLGLDILQPEVFGLYSFSFLIIAFIVSKLHQNVNKKQLGLIALSILFVNFIYSSLIFMGYAVSVDFSWALLLNTLFSGLYNWIFSFVMIYLLVFFDKLQVSIDD
ncbi:MAG: rod shape-determining protein MreD [Candidatus Cloacimonadales bacterium]